MYLYLSLKYFVGHIYIENYSLFIWNPNLSGSPVMSHLAGLPPAHTQAWRKPAGLCLKHPQEKVHTSPAGTPRVPRSGSLFATLSLLFPNKATPFQLRSSYFWPPNGSKMSYHPSLRDTDLQRPPSSCSQTHIAPQVSGPAPISPLL